MNYQSWSFPGEGELMEIFERIKLILNTFSIVVTLSIIQKSQQAKLCS